MSIEHRQYPRFPARVSVEIHSDESEAPLRCSTSDISLGGCYIESMYPFPVGTSLELKLHLEETLLLMGKVVTCYPQVGNGIQFTRILPEDHELLSKFLDAVAKQEPSESGPEVI